MASYLTIIDYNNIVYEYTKRDIPDNINKIIKYIHEHKFIEANFLLYNIKEPEIIYALEYILNQCRKLTYIECILVRNIVSTFNNMYVDSKYVNIYLNIIINSCYAECDNILIELLQYKYLSETMIQYIMQQLIITGPHYLAIFLDYIKFMPIDHKYILKKVIEEDFAIWKDITAYEVLNKFLQ